jgi:WD40 repeat protein
MSESLDPAPPTAPRKRWLPRLRFSLRTLVILVLLIGSGATLRLHWEPWYRAVRFPDQRETVWKLYFSPDGRTVAAATLDGQVEIDDPKTGEAVSTLPMESGLGCSPYISFSPDSRRMLASNERSLRVWDLSSGKEVLAIKPTDPSTVILTHEIPYQAQFTPDGKWIVGNPPYRIWNAETGEVRAIFPWRAYFREEQERAVAPRRPERIAAALRAEDLNEFSRCIDIVSVEVAISPNAKYLLTAIEGCVQKQIWDVSSGKLISRIGITQEINGLRTAVFAPDGTLFCIFMESDKAIHVWDTVTGQQVASLSGLPVPCILAEISGDNRRLLAHYYRDLHPQKLVYNGFERDDETRNIRVWDIESGSVLTSIDGVDCGNAFPGNFSPDGTKIFMSYAVCDSANGQCVLAADRTERFTSFSPDSHSVATSYSWEGVHSASIFHRRRPEHWWGLAWLPEFWLTVVFAGAFAWSVWRDRRVTNG